MQTEEGIQLIVKQYVLREFLPGESPEELTPDFELITHGVLDSIAMLKLVEFLERTFELSIAPNEAGKQHMNTLTRIGQLVASKLGPGKRGANTSAGQA